MNRRAAAWVIGLVTVIVVAACGDQVPTQPEPRVADTLTTDRFLILDYAGTDTAVLNALAARLESDFDGVGGLLPGIAPPAVPVTFIVDSGGGIPVVIADQNTMVQWHDDLAPAYFAHQLTHLYTRYTRTPFLEEGLAVWITGELADSSERPNPYRGQSAHAWMSYFVQHQSTISLFTAMRATNLGASYGGSSADASAWQLRVEAGSFARWVIETYGRGAWDTLYATTSLATALGQDTPLIEQAWQDSVTNRVPAPLECEVALGTVGSREEYWCARARGG